VADRTSSTPADSKQLESALQSARTDPSSAAHWEKLENIAETLQRPTDVSQLFRSVLDATEDVGLASELGQRAVRFQEAWFGEDSSELPELLKRVLTIDPEAEWAFQRLTVAYTVAERWKDLLALYDSAIEGATNPGRRMQLLDEAAHVAKDFAGEPDRAIGYLMQLFRLEPSKASLATSLERLLERQGRHQDLVDLWTARLAVVPPDAARKLRVQLATCALTELQSAALALEHVNALLEQNKDDADALGLLERVLIDAAVPSEQRRAAFDLLKETFLRKKKKDDVVRLLEARLDFATVEERSATLRELVERLSAQGKEARAVDFQALLLQTDTSAEVQDGLRQLAERTRRYDRYASAFVEAAGVATRPADAANLLLEAARAQADLLGSAQDAADLYRRVIALDAVPEANLRATRRLSKLLEGNGRPDERLEILERLSTLEPEEADRQRVLGQLAKLAEQQGDRPRSVRAWNDRLALDAKDGEAIDALIAAHTGMESWPELVRLLGVRAEMFGASPRRRADLTVIARVYSEHTGDVEGAIATWRQIEKEFGEDAETARALIDLLGRASQWPELADVLKAAADRETATFTDLYVRLGDAYREHLRDPQLATRSYRSALQADASRADAREGLLALVDDPACRATALGALVQAFREADEWQRIVALTDARLAALTDVGDQAAVLVEAAKLQEKRGDAPGEALTLYKRAFSLVPGDRAVEGEIRRLAQQLDAWDVAVATYAETIETLSEDSARAAELYYEQGTILESRLRDEAGALRAYVAAAGIAPHQLGLSESAVRLSAKLGEWKSALKSMLDHVVTAARMEPLLIEVLESAAIARDEWSALATGFADALGSYGGMSPPLARELNTLCATWLRDRAEDSARATECLKKALELEPQHTGTLTLLAEVQRETPSRGLVDTLMRLSAQKPGELATLREALQVASTHVQDDAPLIESVATSLSERASVLLERGDRSAKDGVGERALLEAVNALTPLLVGSDRTRQAIGLLSSSSRLLPAEHSTPLLHRAAELAFQAKLNEAATDLYRQVADRDPTDALALARLADLYRTADALPELLATRRRQLALGPDPATRLDLRIEVAGILGQIEARGGRLQVLRANLEDQPGHPETLVAVTQLLTAQRDLPQLASVLAEQAARVETTPDAAVAPALWRRVAELSEQKLRDPAGAIAAYRKLFALEPQGDAADCLARLYAAKGDHAGAAEWLEKRLASVPKEERTQVALQLARARMTAGEPARAQEYLERALAEDPAASEVRALLVTNYREQGRWEALVALLMETADQIEDTQERLACLREAIDVCRDRLDDVSRAVPSLERAAELSPDDRDLQLELSRALVVAGRFTDARTVLQRVIDAFGRKRNQERAAVHFELAKVARAQGDVEAAFENLEHATKMDLADVRSQHMLGQLAKDQGDHDRAERAFRGLLMLLRRIAPTDIVGVGPSETFYELYEMARARGDEAQAQELLESALETAAQHDVEAARFQAALSARGEHELVLRVIESRLRAPHEPLVEAAIVAARATALEALDRKSEALEGRLRAVELDPESLPLGDAARRLAHELGQEQRYMDALTNLSETVARKRNKKARKVAAQLLLRVGEVIEQDLADLDRAAAMYARVEASGECVVEASLKLAAVAGARGNRAEQRRVLQQILDAEVTEELASVAADAAYQLAEIELSSKATVADGVIALKAALARAPRYEVAKDQLESALALAPSAEALALYGEVARASGDEAMLLRWHEHAAGMEASTVGTIRQGVELAFRLREPARAEALLKAAATALEKAPDPEVGTWVYTSLADARSIAEDAKGALHWLKLAAETAPDEARVSLFQRLADAASGPRGDLKVAADAHQWLFENDSSQRWRGYLDVLSRLGDRARFDEQMPTVLDALLDASERNLARLAHARFLLDVCKAQDDAVPVLQDLLNDDPDAHEGAALLATLYEQKEMHSELADLLQRQFDRARDIQDKEQIGVLGLRIGGLLESERPADAMDVYRNALDWVPDSLELLRALLALLGEDSDPGERADLMQRILPLVSGDDAIALCERLVGIWTELDDQTRIEETLRLGYSVAPQHAPIRERLEAWYAERSDWRPFAELMVAEAMRLAPSMESVARLKNAAVMYRDELADTAAAADALRKALTLVPDDLSLLGELARNLAAAGEHRAAIDDVTRLLEGHEAQDSARVDLLRIRADLYATLEEQAAAVVDLEAAYAIAPTEIAGLLVEALATRKGRAAADAERGVERQASLRLVRVLGDMGSPDAARSTLVEWVDRAPTDIEALRMLRDLDTARADWDAVIATCQQLLTIEQDDGLAAAALALVDACDNAGRPGDALEGLESAFAVLRDNVAIKRALRDVYERSGAHAKLAALLLSDAGAASDPQERLPLLHRAADLFLSADNPEAALPPLTQAHAIEPDSEQTMLLLIDAYTKLERFEEASQMLEEAIAGHKKKRSPELARLQHRMARLAERMGDQEARLGWLNNAFETDRTSDVIAAELAELSFERNDHETAMKALRVISMMDEPVAMTKAMSFLRQAQIAHATGDSRRAGHWARKAKSLDADLHEAQAFLDEIGG